MPRRRNRPPTESCYNPVRSIGTVLARSWWLFRAPGHETAGPPRACGRYPHSFRLRAPTGRIRCTAEDCVCVRRYSRLHGQHSDLVRLAYSPEVFSRSLSGDSLTQSVRKPLSPRTWAFGHWSQLRPRRVGGVSRVNAVGRPRGASCMISRLYGCFECFRARVGTNWLGGTAILCPAG